MTYLRYCFHIEKSLLYSFIYRFYTHYPNRFLLFYCFHKTLPKFFSFILLFPQMKVLWYFALFSKGKVSHLFTWCSHIIWQFLTFVAPPTYRKCFTWVAECTLMGQQRISMNVGMMDTYEMTQMTLLVYALRAQCIRLHRSGLGHTQESHIINNSLSNPSLAFMDWLFPSRLSKLESYAFMDWICFH